MFMLHVAGVYWWYCNNDLLYPLIMLPPKAIPPFWHAIFIIMVNGSFSYLINLLLGISSNLLCRHISSDNCENVSGFNDSRCSFSVFWLFGNVSGT